jgi:adenine deaminase
LKERDMSRSDLVPVAMGSQPADLVIVGGRLVNVGSGEIYPADIAIKGGRIAVVGDVEYTIGKATEKIDAEGRFLTPGLVEAHLHSYHAYVGVPEFTEALLRHGVTSYADGFYGQGIVGGTEAVRFFKEAFEAMPVRLLFVVPTLAYLQNRDSGLTPAPGVTPEEMIEMLDWPGCYGLEEPPSTSLVEQWPEMVELCERTLEKRQVITGHAAALDQRTLQAYAAMGVTTDHEAVSTAEGIDRIRLGFNLFMRMSSSAFHQLDLQKGITEERLDTRHFGFCADEASPTKMVDIGTTAHNLRQAVAAGIPPITAVQMGTINNAEAFFAQADVGQIAPGRFADILLVDDLTSFTIDRVLVGGETWVEQGELVRDLPGVDYPAFCFDTVKISEPVRSDDMLVAAPVDERQAEVRVIGVKDGDYVCDERRATLKVENGRVQPDLAQDILPLAMVDRFEKGSQGIGCGFVQGFGLERGAIASTVNAVCENVVVVGADPDDMALACNRLVEIGGGFIVVDGGEVVATVELPLLGLMNDEPLDVVMPKFEQAFAAIKELGCELTSPFVSLEFSFACPGIPDIKMSDEGLIRISPPERLDVVVETKS